MVVLWGLAATGPLLASDAPAPVASGSSERGASLGSAPVDVRLPLTRIAFGSCYKVSRGGDGIWRAISTFEPQLFIFAGDTLYPDADDDTADLPRLRRAYDDLVDLPAFAALRARTPVLAVWDDHDFGKNDGGADFPWREQSEDLFEEHWLSDPDDDRRGRPGLYVSREIGHGDQRVQIIVLDTRYFRSPLKATDDYGARGRERYIPDDDPGKTMLGADQWAWLESQLQRPAALRLLVSSVQVLADGHGWEGWKQLPGERDRLLNLLKHAAAAPVIILSGDRHVAGFYEQDIGSSETLLEFTSSSLNNTISFPNRQRTLDEAGPRRLGALYGEANFGSLQFDWNTRVVQLSLHDAEGAIVRQLQRSLGQ
jgi:alkaline phosphatase D